ncbi:MAG: tetratricopeptide repeat protein [Paracoccaceae bacterium]|nr:tetratricopeptide repeat protein [Paracoccaceae bacterium]
MTLKGTTRIATATCALALLASCGAGKLTPERLGPPPPPGTPVIHEAVDGLIVGHRLMAAGEYELALSAYYRAAAEHGLNADVLSAIGSADLKLGRLGQAEERLRSALLLDPTSIPALNNLGVVLMNEGKVAEAKGVFQNAFALDSGQSDVIRKNLMAALAAMDKSTYDQPKDTSKFSLVRRGSSSYLLLSTP